MPKESAIRVTVERIEETLVPSPTWAGVEGRFDVVPQGRSCVHLQVLPWKPERARVLGLLDASTMAWLVSDAELPPVAWDRG